LTDHRHHQPRVAPATRPARMTDPGGWQGGPRRSCLTKRSRPSGPPQIRITVGPRRRGPLRLRSDRFVRGLERTSPQPPGPAGWLNFWRIDFRRHGLAAAASGEHVSRDAWLRQRSRMTGIFGVAEYPSRKKAFRRYVLRGSVSSNSRAFRIWRPVRPASAAAILATATYFLSSRYRPDP
jgi:hypothetical protein